MDIFAEPLREEKVKKQPPNKTSDELITQMAKQAIQDDENLAPVADQINVNVQNGAVTVEGKVTTDEQSNLVSATAQAVGAVDEVKNRIEIVKKK